MTRVAIRLEPSGSGTVLAATSAEGPLPPVRKWTAAVLGRSAKSMNLVSEAMQIGPRKPIAKEGQGRHHACVFLPNIDLIAPQRPANATKTPMATSFLEASSNAIRPLKNPALVRRPPAISPAIPYAAASSRLWIKLRVEVALVERDHRQYTRHGAIDARQCACLCHDVEGLARPCGRVSGSDS